MSDDKKHNRSEGRHIELNEDRGLAPRSSRTPMPTVKPPKDSGTTSQKSDGKK